MLSSYGFVNKVTKLATHNAKNFLKTVITFSHYICPLKILKILKNSRNKIC